MCFNVKMEANKNNIFKVVFWGYLQEKSANRFKGLGFFLLKGFTDTDQLLCYLLKEESAVISSLKIMFHTSATTIYPGSWDGTTGSCPILECQLQVSVCCMK